MSLANRATSASGAEALDRQHRPEDSLPGPRTCRSPHARPERSAGSRRPRRSRGRRARAPPQPGTAPSAMPRACAPRPWPGAPRDPAAVAPFVEQPAQPDPPGPLRATSATNRSCSASSTSNAGTRRVDLPGVQGRTAVSAMSTAASKSASAKTMLGFLPPSSSATFFTIAGRLPPSSRRPILQAAGEGDQVDVRMVGERGAPPPDRRPAPRLAVPGGSPASASSPDQVDRGVRGQLAGSLGTKEGVSGRERGATLTRSGEAGSSRA